MRVRPLLFIFAIFLMTGPIASHAADSNKEFIISELLENNFFTKTPGTALSICKKDICESYAAGTADPNSNRPLAKDALFRVGSLSKTIVAVLIMQLVDEGLLSLSDSLATFLPEYPQWSHVTIKHLMRMESGIPLSLFSKEDFLRNLYQIITGKKSNMTPRELVDSIKNRKMRFNPGEKSEYNNTNYILLGLILEKIRNQSLHTIFEERIVYPLGLTQTYLDIGDSIDPRLTPGFIQAFSLGLPNYLTHLFPKNKKRNEGLVEVTNSLPTKQVWASGAIVSSVTNMNQFIRALFEYKFFGPEILAQMLDFVTCDIAGLSAQYGLGIMEYSSPFGKLYGHGGVGLGYQGMTFYSPEKKVSFVVTQNAGPTNTSFVFSRLIDGYFTGFKSPYFIPKLKIIPENFDKGIHLRVKGFLNRTSYDQVVGYGRERRFLSPSQSFNFFTLKTVRIKNRDFIEVKARNMNSFASVVPSLRKSIPIAKLLIDRDYLYREQRKNSGLISIKGGSLIGRSVIAYSGREFLSPQGLVQKECVDRILDLERESIIQIRLEKNANLSFDNTVKLMGNLAFRKPKKSDKRALKILNLKQCN